nr:putative disease resistance protein RGA3 [Quercus suber]
MAEGTFIEVVEGVIGKTGNLADQIGLSSRVKDELEKLRNTVSAIKPVVPDAEEKQERDHEVSEWLRRLKDAVYEADNLLEEFSNEVSRRDQMTQNKEAKKKLLGESDKKAIIGILLDPNVEENVVVLPIVGSGGLGKTTLAKLVFSDEEIGNHFEIRFWVCASDDFDKKITVQKILKSAKGEIKEALDMNTLINDLHQGSGGRRYLLVLDDVWSEDNGKWNSLKVVLLCAARGSRILVTTRLQVVARIIQTIQPYFLREVSPEASWILFKRCAFKEGEEPVNRIREIGMEIVKKCTGVPLAIKIMGGILCSKRDVGEWLFFLNNDLSEVTQGKNVILSTLKSSYDHLPPHLKQCCAYCSLFPKDYNINKHTLIRLWMAQGFIKLSHPNQCLEDVGHEYFLELLWRSFFHVVAEDKLGNTSVKVHDLIHDLLTSVAGQESAIIDTDGEHIADAERTRHLSLGFHFGSSSLTNTLFQTSNLRTFLLCGQQSGEHENGLNESNCYAIFSSFKFLRVLDLHETGIKTIPSSISDLNHVRYLDLSDNRLIEMLP